MNKKIITVLMFAMLLTSMSVVALTHFVAATNPADLNGDGKVNFQDVVIFAQNYALYYSGNTWNHACDLDGNGILNWNDALLFIADYVAAGQAGLGT